MGKKVMTIKSAKYFSVLLNNFLYELFVDLYDASSKNLTTENLQLYQSLSALLMDIIHFINNYSFEDNNYELEKLKVCDYIDNMKEVAARKYGVDSQEYKGYMAAMDEIKKLYKPDYHIDVALIDKQIQNLTKIKEEIDTYGVNIQEVEDIDDYDDEDGDDYGYKEE